MKLISIIAICTSLTACASTQHAPEPCQSPEHTMAVTGVLTVAVPFVGLYIGRAINDARQEAHEECLKNQKTAP